MIKIHNISNENGVLISKTDIDNKVTYVFAQVKLVENSTVEQISSEIFAAGKDVRVDIYQNNTLLRSFLGEFIEYKITQNQYEVGKYDLLEQLDFKVTKEVYNF